MKDAIYSMQTELKRSDAAIKIHFLYPLVIKPDVFVNIKIQ